MTKALSNKKSNFLIFLCWTAYTFSYVAKLNYNASMVEILSQLGTTKQAAGTVSSFFFFAYGAGQLINGLLSKKYNTKYSVTVALAASCIINLAMTNCTGTEQMKYLWFLNGLFQSILWSSLIKTLSDNLKDNKLSKAVLAMSSTIAVGTFVTYALATLFSHLQLKWTIIFYVASFLVGIVAVVWFVGMSVLQKENSKADVSDSRVKTNLSFSPAFIISVIVIMISAVTNGFVKDGITTWVPSILKEEFGVPSSLSIFVTLILPVLAIIGTSFANRIHKKLKDENILSGIFYFATSALTALILFTLSLKSVPLTLTFFGGIACLMSALNNIITGAIPLYSRDKIDSGLSAGILNAFGYAGSTLSASMLGKIADTKGWSDVFVCILIFSTVTFTLCFFTAFAKKRQK